MMASSFNFPTLQGPICHKSHFLGQTHFTKSPSTPPKLSTSTLNITAKFNLFEIMGGRGLLNGEQNLQQELKKSIQQPPPPTTTNQETSTPPNIPQDGFGKELLGLTGGFPGGEKGLKQFIQQNPPPPKNTPPQNLNTTELNPQKPKPPQLPLFMPGMIAIVKNENSPYYMMCGIVQRITDGKAGVLFEGGNWDRLITFKLNELERREKGPPMVSPRSVILEAIVENN